MSTAEASSVGVAPFAPRISIQASAVPCWRITTGPVSCHVPSSRTSTVPGRRRATPASIDRSGWACVPGFESDPVGET